MNLRRDYRPTPSSISAIAGAIASASFAVGDVLLLGKRATPDDRRLLREQEDVHPSAATLMAVGPQRSRAGALFGVIAAPLHVVSAWSIYDALSPGGTRRAARVAGTYAAAMAWVGYIHGTFYPWAAAFNAADRAEPGSTQRAEALAEASRIERSIEIPYTAFALIGGAAALETTALVALGKSRFPRWAAPLVTPLAPTAAVIAATRVLPAKPGHVVSGASLSLGMLAANAAAAWIRRRPESAAE
ncbi:hypothetical protein GOARA_045_00020 [Gordonia araii NBRC 100433]|uniref:Uncharacterized protein n=1 Tax=Gordonia araii NBRC 100433 TaxID=1073574 RepID=G7H1C3_9ACTN|nr:DUF6796 family protein [Gordonia araii]NNG97844.1 hypothetical protein [Gordonia araii NBRC 100433]GAB09648.1 hypothetical protein GOARA_045_00020 [Gordonia araii NBRC 100433]